MRYLEGLKLLSSAAFMRTSFYLAAALALATEAAEAQAPTPSAESKVKVKTKASRTVATAKPIATDWSVPYAARITPAELKQDLSLLASDAYEGRGTGQKGQKMAADYLAKAFKAAGLTGPVPNSANPYFQRFMLHRVGVDSSSSIQIGSRTFVLNKDFYVILRDPAAASATIQPTFVGYGISTPAYADFAASAPDLQHKDLVVLLGEPQTKAGQPLLGKNGQPSPYGLSGIAEMGERSPALRSLAPRSTFRIMPSAAAFAKVPQDYPFLFGQGPDDQISFPGEQEPVPTGTSTNVFFISPEMGAALLGTTPAGLAQYQQAVAAAGKPVAPAFKPGPVELRVRNRAGDFTTENVLGYLEGSDKKDEVLVLSAHYDHIGRKNGVVYNGADDDGSGTVSVLAMARAFALAKKDGHGPRRSLLFLANVGEEVSLLGSRYYTDHPVFPLANTVALLHLDMVGRVDSAHQSKGDYLYLIGDNWLSTDLHMLSEATNQQYHPLALDYKYNSIADPAHLYSRSDHYNFSKHQVPVIFYASGFHADYHQPTDDVATIDFPAMTRRGQAIFHMAWAVANRDQRPVVDAQHRSTAFAPAAADLARYAGTYTSPQLPMKIAISQSGTTLTAKPTYQAALPLEAVAPGVFKADQVGARVEFDPARPGFTFKQGGSSYVFTKE
jgi:hypothetical protein